MQLNPSDCLITAWPPQPSAGMQTGQLSAGVRIVHQPTGCAVECVRHRHMHQNKSAALDVLAQLVEAGEARHAQVQNISNRNLDQLRQYAEWEKTHFPDDRQRLHVLDWAVSEIERLRLELNQIPR